MELEVKVVAGMETCFVSLPLSLIQTLQSTSSKVLPPVLALELRSRSGDDHWHVAWSGSASSSSAIEVAQQLAECISLPNNVIVRVRAVSHLSKATLVTIEPNSEDDWEVLELNSEHAEAVILKQVGIVHEGMRFPLWLHGHAIVEFLVASTFPKKAVVQLVPGTEVAVAPKRRKTNVDSGYDSHLKHSENAQSTSKALLRVQDLNQKMFHRCEVNNVRLSVGLTSAVLIHPETAKNSMFDNLQLVDVFPRLAPMENMKKKKSYVLRKSNSTSKESNLGISTEESSRHTIVRLIYSELVAQGHVMLPQSLRLYLRAGLHSWIYVKRCNLTPKKDVPSVTLSPCRFKFSGTDNILKENGLNFLENQINPKTKTLPYNSNLVADAGITDWSIHEEVPVALSSHSASHEVQDITSHSYSEKGLQSLLHAWCIGQFEAITSNTGIALNSLALGNETLLHFEVIDHKFRNHGKEHASDGCFPDGGNRTREPSCDMLYLLTTTDDPSHSEDYDIYEFSAKDENTGIDNMRSIEMSTLKLNIGDPVHLASVAEKISERRFSSTISSLSWMGSAISDVIDRLTVLLSPTPGKLISTYKLPFPGHALICGPAGCGKTSLATAVAKAFEEQDDILAHTVFISCSRLALEKAPTLQQALKGYISEALEHSPSLVIFDDLDSIASSSPDSEGSQPSTSTTALVEFLVDIMDEYGEKRQHSCGIGPIAFMASAHSLEKLPPSLSSSGRFDFHVQLPAPAVTQRGAILMHEIRKRSLQCSEEILQDIASRCDGYDAYDLEILVDRAVHAAIGRFLSCNSAIEEHESPALVTQDFSQAMQDFLPVSMRDITKSVSEGGSSGWEDVGGLIKIRDAIQEMVELPAKFPSIFMQAPLRLRSNVLLYGPPGCGKTHIVGAAAAACSLRFISVKGPELLNKYIGASEQAVRDIFSKAAAAAPCLLFFDEFDSIAPKRGHDNTGVTDRVVNQLLTELDGVEVLTGVFVFAATSRPDLLDAALLRPGRLDRLLFCDFPTWHDRVDILRVLSRKLPLASDVDLDAIASVTEGFSGADLQALLSDAQLASVHELLESGDNGKPGKMPMISGALLKDVATKTRPSVSEAEKRRLYGIYSQFLDSKKSIAAQSRDAKGKRATLA